MPSALRRYLTTYALRPRRRATSGSEKRPTSSRAGGVQTYGGDRDWKGGDLAGQPLAAHLVYGAAKAACQRGIAHRAEQFDLAGGPAARGGDQLDPAGFAHGDDFLKGALQAAGHDRIGREAELIQFGNAQGAPRRRKSRFWPGARRAGGGGLRAGKCRFIARILYADRLGRQARSRLKGHSAQRQRRSVARGIRRAARLTGRVTGAGIIQVKTGCQPDSRQVVWRRLGGDGQAPANHSEGRPKGIRRVTAAPAYFPMQNWLKIRSSRSSVVVWPTISPTALTAMRRSSATSSRV